MPEDNIDIIPQQDKKLKIKTIKKFIIVFIFVVIFGFLFAPQNTKDTIIHVVSGQSINSIVLELKNKNVVHNDFILKIFIKLINPKNKITIGDYLIKENSSIWVVAWQIGTGYHNIKQIKITIREGATNEEIAKILSEKLVNFDKDLFLNNTKDKQGYLFPDTYFFYPQDKPDEIIKKLSNNFDLRIKNIPLDDFKNKNLSDIITMASVLEGEASGQEDIGIISGILWRRISMGMPLQVDVDKSTYENKGLPKKPLNNPGLDSIKASLNPIDSKYLYYLHEKNGTVHYGMTFEEHKLNIKKYLK